MNYYNIRLIYMNAVIGCVGLFLIALAVLYGFKSTASATKEGFIGGSTLTTDFFIPTYQACRAQGYSREFCVQTPEEGSPGSCMCGDGRRGKYLVGYRGQCVCDDHNPYQLAY